MDEYLNKSITKEIKDLLKTNEGLSLAICEIVCLIMTAINIFYYYKIIQIEIKDVEKYVIIWPSWTIVLFIFHIWITSMFSEKSLINKINYFTMIIVSTVYHFTKNAGLI